MNKNFAFALILALLAASCLLSVKPTWAATPDSWTAKAPMQQARSHLGVAVVNGKIYAIGGYGGSGPDFHTNEEYDPATDTWTFKAPMPTSRMSFGIAAFENKIYCIGGYGGTRANEVYDPATDTWQNKASIPVSNYASTASVVDGKIYVVGSGSNVTQVYDPATDSWTQKAPMPVMPPQILGWSCASACLDGKIHVIGSMPHSNSHQVYDPPTDSWSLGTPAIAGIYFASAGVTAGILAPERIYVFGADSQWWPNGVLGFGSEAYDPATGNWTVCAPMLTDRINVAVATVNDTLYVIGGETIFIGDNAFSSAVNEQYLPLGYGTVASASPTPPIPEMPSPALMLGLVVAFSAITVALKKKVAHIRSPSCFAQARNNGRKNQQKEFE